MSTFAATFRELVMPDLRRMCRLQGLLIALDIADFSDASNEVFDHARKRGAMHLPVGRQSDMILELHNWIDTTLLRAIDEFMPDVTARRAIADRVACDIARCEAQWVTT